jgi:hypothetical protein
MADTPDETKGSFKMLTPIDSTTPDAELLRRALGYAYDSMQSVELGGGKIVQVPIVVHVIPETEACIEWLVRRRPDEWKRYPDAAPAAPPIH